MMQSATCPSRPARPDSCRFNWSCVVCQWDARRKPTPQQSIDPSHHRWIIRWGLIHALETRDGPGSSA